jgi:hypothetical protein
MTLSSVDADGRTGPAHAVAERPPDARAGPRWVR